MCLCSYTVSDCVTFGQVYYILYFPQTKPLKEKDVFSYYHREYLFMHSPDFEPIR